MTAPVSTSSSTRIVDIDSIRLSDGARRIDWRVRIDGRDFDLYFKSKSHDLSTAIEPALVGALLPSMGQSSIIRPNEPVDMALLSSIPVVQDIVLQWDTSLSRAEVDVPSMKPLNQAPSRGVGCFFTGGVDSFYTFLKNKSSISHLVFVHGYDIPLENTDLRNAVSERITAIGKTFDKEVIELETNLRSLIDAYTPWYLAHGSALAAAAHVVATTIAKIYVPASHTYTQLFPWGSHPLLDPLWSSSSLSFVHDGCECNRTEKVQAISSSDAALQTLRVCYKNPGGKYNCGRCEKCLRTMINLRAAGSLSRCTTFEEPISLKRVRQISIRNESGLSFVMDNLRALEAKNDPEDRGIIRALRYAVRKPRWLNRWIHSLRQKAIRNPELERYARPAYKFFKTLRGD